jgi:uncharacterized protein YndB with AHSA1/START domain
MDHLQDLPPVAWKVHLASPPAAVFELLTTDAGRERFWAETSRAEEDAFMLTFSGGEQLRCAIVAQSAPRCFAFRYFAETLVEITLTPDGNGGTDLALTEIGFADEAHRTENYAGWIQVLLCLKAAADHGVDLRNHDPTRTWASGFCEG